MKRLIKKSSIPIISDLYDTSDYQFEDMGIQRVKVDDITCMSYPRNLEYNDDFSPKQQDERWEYQYNLVQNGKTLEPIELILMPNNKYAIDGDGNHRLSVAKTCNLEYIDAKVFKMIKEKTNLNKININELQKRYEKIWNKIRTDYTLKDKELEKLENEMFEIADMIEELS